MDVRFARLDIIDLSLVDIEANHLEASLEASVREWESNVTKADDADGGGLRFDLLEEFGSDCVLGLFRAGFSGFQCCLKVSRPYSSAVNQSRMK